MFTHIELVDKVNGRELVVNLILGRSNTDSPFTDVELGLLLKKHPSPPENDH